jgi:acyl carrier protein
MTMDTVAGETRAMVESVLHRIAPEITPSEIDPDADLHVDLDLDSMDFLSFVIALHDETGVEIPERDYPLVATLAGCVEYLDERRR